MKIKEITDAFIALHSAWLGASHRQDMNEEMDELARRLGLDPLTLKPMTQDSEEHKSVATPNDPSSATAGPKTL